MAGRARSRLFVLTAALVVLAFLGTPALRAGPDDLHFYLTGHVGEANVQVDLALGTGGLAAQARGSYFYVASTGRRLNLRGTNTPGSLHLTEFTEDDPPKSTGQWKGEFRAGRFTGTWRSGDGRRSLPFEVAVTAGYSSETASAPRHTIGLCWPVFTNGAFGRAVTAEVEKSVRADKADFLDTIKDPADDVFAGKRYGWDDDWRIEYYTDGLISLRRYCDKDAGQAGGNHGVARIEGHTYLKTSTGARLLTETDILRRPESWEGVAEPVYEELRRQGAQYVADGQIRSASDLSLSQLTVNRTGITFHFGSYAVAAYQQGTFAAFIPFRDIQACLHPKFKVP